jgi:DNA-binding transcriptional regulator/RsmH inhibitor MraZ
MTSPNYKLSRKIIINISLLLIISSLLVIGLIFLQTRRLSESASKFQLEQSISKINSEFNAYIAPVRNSLILFTEWGKTGLLEDRRKENIIAKFLPILNKVESIEYISIATEDGDFLVLSDSNNVIITKQINSLDDSVWTLRQWNNDLVQVGYRFVKLLPGTRKDLSLLFPEGMQEDTTIISSVRYFYETSNIGINYCRYYKSKRSDKKYRISIGVLLNKIAEWLDSRQVGNDGRVVLFDLKGRIFRPQKIDTDLDEVQDSLFLAELDSVNQTLEFVALSKWKNLSFNVENNFRFKYNNEYWWAGMLHANPGRDQYDLWVSVIIPEKDLLDFIHGTKGFVIIGILFVLLISIVTITVIVSRSAKKNAAETNQQDELENESSIMKMIEKGENEKLEFKSTIRHNLHTGKPGKEIEIAWLKGVASFLNSEGGILFIGVNDDGNIVGLEPDNFANDDRCLLHIQNLIKQHIGLEFSPYIDIKIRELELGKIISISCTPSTIPVFLKNNDKEQFFVRSGPSSVALPLSKALKYIEDRKKKN